jgi:hypothetical protein
VLIVENNKKDYNLLKSIPGIGGYLASVIWPNVEIYVGSITKDSLVPTSD